MIKVKMYVNMLTQRYIFFFVHQSCKLNNEFGKSETLKIYKYDLPTTRINQIVVGKFYMILIIILKC